MLFLRLLHHSTSCFPKHSQQPSLRSETPSTYIPRNPRVYVRQSSNISVLMNKWEYSLVSQFVSNVVLFSLVVKTRLLDASSHDHTCRVLPFKQASNPIRVHVHLEVLVHQLNGFFVSGPVTTQQTLVTSALAASAPLPCLPCFCTVLLCLTVIRATHGLLADRAPVYRGCPCRDPLGCPLIPKQNGIRDKAPTLWLLLCCCNCCNC